MRQPTCVAGLAVLITALAPEVLAGGGEYGTDNGAESVARAGASTALASPAALYTNVAGIADTRKVDLYLTNNFIFRRLWFQRAPLEGRAFAAVEDSTPVFWGPALAAHIRLTPWLALAVGAHGPAAVGWGHFPAGSAEQDADLSQKLTGASRFDLTEMNVIMVYPTLALGLRVPGHPQLRIGASFQPGFAHVSFTTYASSGGELEALLVGDEVRAELDLWDYFIPAGQLGLLYRLWRFELGAQVRFSGSIEATGEVISTNYPRHGPGAVTDPDRRPAARARLTVPWPLAVARLGLRYAHPRLDLADDAVFSHERDLFDIELDFIFENTSVNDGFDATFTDVSVLDSPEIPEGELRIPLIELHVAHQWRDTYGLRLGGSYHLFDGLLSLSAGASWESATVSNAYTRLDFAAWGRFGVAAGATLRLSMVELSLAYQHLFMLDRLVTDGQVRQLKAGADSGVTDQVINNGRYRGSYDILGFSVALRL